MPMYLDIAGIPGESQSPNANWNNKIEIQHWTYDVSLDHSMEVGRGWSQRRARRLHAHHQGDGREHAAAVRAVVQPDRRSTDVYPREPDLVPVDRTKRKRTTCNGWWCRTIQPPAAPEWAAFRRSTGNGLCHHHRDLSGREGWRAAAGACTNGFNFGRGRQQLRVMTESCRRRGSYLTPVKLNQAIEALGAELRDNPTDAQRRLFCSSCCVCRSVGPCGQAAGRAGRRRSPGSGPGRSAGAQQGPSAGALLYRAAIGAERTRQEMFRDKAAQSSNPPASAGTLNGRVTFNPSRMRIRASARAWKCWPAENYMWIPLEHIAIDRDGAAQASARSAVGAGDYPDRSAGSNGADLAKCCSRCSRLSATHADDAVRLGRMTVWETSATARKFPSARRFAGR